MTAPRVALLGMILESNRFAKPAGEDDFRSLTWLSGEDLLDAACAKTTALAAEFAAFVRTMDATGDWHPVPCTLAASHPAGPVERAVFEEICNSIEHQLAGHGPFDAGYICNHGAMVAEHSHDPDGDLMQRVRESVGADPLILCTLDLHANISSRMVEACDLVIGYRTNPHVDMIERGEEAAFSLRRCLASGQRPRTALVKPPIAPASVTLLTAEAPYGDLINYGQQRQAESAGEILNVSVFGNFIFSDTPDNGLAVVVSAREDGQAARDLATEIGKRAWNQRAGFVRNLTQVDQAVAMAADTERPPVIFSDAGDNPGGGGSGRTTELLGALHRGGVESVLYGSFFDPDLAAEAHALGVGASFTARFNRKAGGRVWEKWDLPFEARATVLSLHDGNVVGEKGITAGRRLHLGPCAALELDGIRVVVISDRAQTADPVFFHMLGLNVGDARTVVVKSRGHFRAGFRKWFAPEQVFEIDTAGLTSPVLERWPFEHLPRPSYPLDPDMVWDEAEHR
ncbi:MAG: M81 family metallopeptidase [Roseibium sp.]|uniref:M81 family metallopeptidase n=1 Tax=Roseibium sp. TaxID=1936156 RepID=UPI001B1A00E9|nr:M81 family metallopeptidase [Roseibium sp.]MBO6891641.1 M81 family metallopeptidase [Roseibium sp.]MBO6929838.1 M81 family metallopeptidase [Roseibium sp.]